MEQRPKPPGGSGFTEEENKGGMKLPSGGIVLYIVMAAIAIFASLGVNYFVGVSKSGLDSKVTEMNATIDAMKSDLRASKDSITTALNGLSGTVDSKVNSSVSSLTSRINTLESTVSDNKNQATNAVNQVSNLASTITTLQNSIKSLTDTITTLQSTANSNKSDITTLKSQVTVLITLTEAQKTQIADLTTKVNTLTGGGTTITPTTQTGLTASVVSTNPMPLINGTNTVNVSLINNTSKGLYSEQFSFQLQFLSPPSAINTWGLVIASPSITVGTPSYSLVSGLVTYLITGNVFLLPNSSQTISLVVTTNVQPPPTVNFVASITVTGYTALP